MQNGSTNKRYAAIIKHSVRKTTSNIQNHDAALQNGERSTSKLPMPKFKSSAQQSFRRNRRLDEFQNIRTMNDFQKICICYVKMNFRNVNLIEKMLNTVKNDK
jgi:hypothetical protein